MVSSTPRSLFTLGKEPVPILEEAGWAPRPGWTAENLVPTGIFFIITSGGGSIQLSNDSLMQNELYVEHWCIYGIEIYMMKNYIEKVK